MSAEAAADNELPDSVNFRLKDDELAAALADAEDEAGSRSEAVRIALRETYVDGDEDAGENVPEALTDVPLKARSGYRELVETVGEGGHLEVDAAESILANQLNISTDSIRHVVTKPLVNSGALRLRQGIHEVAIVVRPLEDLATDADANLLEDDDGDSEDDLAVDVDDPENASERLDELAAAGEEVRDGE